MASSRRPGESFVDWANRAPDPGTGQLAVSSCCDFHDAGGDPTVACHAATERKDRRFPLARKGTRRKR